jgi:hypothetical protein
LRALLLQAFFTDARHLLTENRNGLIVDVRVTEANGTAERTTALDMLEDNAVLGSTVSADKNYDAAEFVAGCRERGCTPHVAQDNTCRRSAINARTTRHPGYRISMMKRKRIEEPFGWIKTVAGLRKTRHRGRKLVEWFFVLTAAATISFAFEDSGCNGMSLCGVPSMRQYHTDDRASGADHNPSLGFVIIAKIEGFDHKIGLFSSLLEGLLVTGRKRA